MFFVYILHSDKFDRFYVGMTSNLEVRLNYHNSGKVKSTKAFLPWVYVLKENYNSRDEARKRELYLKSAAGRRWRKNTWRARPNLKQFVRVKYKLSWLPARTERYVRAGSVRFITRGHGIKMTKRWRGSSAG